MAKATGRSGGRVANGLVALSSAAVLTIYSAGYLKTRAAAEKLEAADRTRVVIPAPPAASAPEPAAPAAAVAAVRPVETLKPVAAPATPARVKKSTAATAGQAAKATAGQAAKATAEQSPQATAAPARTEEPRNLGTQEPPLPTPTPAPALQSQYKDGTYSGWGTSRHGDIEATVVIAGGRITSAVISQCWTRYSCSWVAHLQGQVVTRQSADVDYVSGATQSTNAFYYAVVQALSKAK